MAASEVPTNNTVDVQKLLARLARPKPFDVARAHLPEIEARCVAAGIDSSLVPRILRKYAHMVAVRQSERHQGAEPHPVRDYDGNPHPGTRLGV